MAKVLKRDRPRIIAKFLQRVHDLPDGEKKKLKAAAVQAQAGDSRPIIDFLKKLITDPELLAALVKLLPYILPLLITLL